MADSMSLTFEQGRNRFFPMRTYWHVTCSCGRRSGQLTERDAKWWAADHLKQHSLGGSGGDESHRK